MAGGVRSRVATVAALVALLAAGGAAAQGCPAATGAADLGLLAGAVRYDVGAGADGVETGLEAAWRPGPLEARLAATRVLLDGGTANPTLIRASVGRPLLVRGRLAFCGAALAGVSWLSGDADRAVTLAGGAEVRVGSRVPLSRGAVTPSLAVRGLGARTTGEVLGLEVSASGASLGVEAGAEVEVGRVVGRASASLDGFDPGLGATPYPARALRLGLGWRF